jgi:hypothetical protein
MSYDFVITECASSRFGINFSYNFHFIKFYLFNLSNYVIIIFHDFIIDLIYFSTVINLIDFRRIFYCLTA